MFKHIFLVLQLFVYYPAIEKNTNQLNCNVSKINYVYFKLIKEKIS